MGLFTTVLKQILKEGTITDKKRISESVFQLTIQSEFFKSVDFVPGHFLRLVIGIDNDQLTREDSVRSYSVWGIDQKNGVVEIAIATHSQGAGANWAATQKKDSPIYFNWKKGKFVLDTISDSFLMIGDLSALSHLYMIRRNISQEKQVESIIYSQHRDELFADLDGSLPFDFYEMQENPFEQILERVKKIVPIMKGTKMVYIAGDSRVCIALTQYFRKELGWSSSQIKTKPFWNPLKKGLE